MQLVIWFPPALLAGHLLESADDSIGGAGRGHGDPAAFGLDEEWHQALLDLGGLCAQQIDVERWTSNDALVEHPLPLLLHAGDRLLEAQTREITKARERAKEILGLVTERPVDLQELPRNRDVVLGRLAHHERLSDGATRHHSHRGDRPSGQHCDLEQFFPLDVLNLRSLL